MLQLSQLPIDRLSCSSHVKGNQICHPMSPVRWARRSTRRSVLLTDALVHSIHQPKLYPLFLFLPLPLCTVGGTVNGIIYIWHRWQSVCKEKLPILLRVGVDSCLLSLFIQMLWRQISLNLSLSFSFYLSCACSYDKSFSPFNRLHFIWVYPSTLSPFVVVTYIKSASREIVSHFFTALHRDIRAPTRPFTLL